MIEKLKLIFEFTVYVLHSWIEDPAECDACTATSQEDEPASVSSEPVKRVVKKKIFEGYVGGKPYIY